MMVKMKYLVFRNNNIPEKPECAVLFELNGLSHKQVARIHRASDYALVSAGFFVFTDIGPSVLIKETSESLNNEFPPRKIHDEEAIRRAIYPEVSR